MDYEKAYNEAIKREKAIIEVAEKEEEVYKSAITIFPELCESEDERIRKEIEQLIQCMHDADPRKKRWIAWLEKQKEYESTDFEYVWDRTDCGALTSALDKYSKEAIINMCHAWYDKGIELERKSWLEKQGEERTINYPIEGMFPYTEPADTLDGEIENIWNKLRNCDNTFTAAKSGLYEVIHHFANWLEKQSYTKKDVDDAYLKGICNTKHELEKQGEQKPTNKIEPKFHEGEWIISNDKKSTYQVIEVKRGIYVIRDNVDNHEYHIGIEECEKSGRLFTIQDAKDGDVLVASDSSIFIFKEVRGSSCKHYIALTSDNEIQVNTKLDKFWETARGVKPSTKEQRDTLLKAMDDAEYTFDFGKKELKKIEKKSQRMVSAEAKEALYDKPTDEEMKELLRTEYEKGRADAIAEMKSSWSEYDMSKVQRICEYLNEAKKYYADITEVRDCIDWLKSIKDRYTWKPSDEQMKALKYVAYHLMPDTNYREEMFSLYEDLKKLK